MLDAETTRPRSIRFFGAGLENASLERELVGEFSRVLASEQILNGPDVLSFEEHVAARSGRRHAIAVNSATDALYFALQANGIGPGDQVLVPAFSYVASASAVLRTGARPVFVDVTQSGVARGVAPCTMDLADAARRITPKSRAMIWVGLYGGIGDPGPIAAFADAHDLCLIEDASQTFGASYNGAPAGRLGEASVFSFDRNKHLGAPGTGGAVVTDQAEVDARVRALRYHGVSKGQFATLGYNSQMSTLSAAVLNAKLERAPAWTERRNDIARRFDRALGQLKVELLTWPKETRHVYQKYVLLTDDRAGLEAHLNAAGVPTKRHYDTPLHREPVFARSVAAGERYPVAESLSSRVLSLPIHAQLSDDDVSFIIEAVNSYFR